MSDNSEEQRWEMRVCELLADRPAALGELVLEIRRAVVQEAGPASELLYKTYALSNVFTYSARLKEAFIHIATYAKHVNLGFNFGSQLPDPDKMLTGEGKLIRHIRINTTEDLEHSSVRQLIREAVEQGRIMAEQADRFEPRQFIDRSAK